jgi:hypothetical protein
VEEKGVAAAVRITQQRVMSREPLQTLLSHLGPLLPSSKASAHPLDDRFKNFALLTILWIWFNFFPKSTQNIISSQL